MSDKIVKQQVAVKSIIECPTCGEPAEGKTRPFCSTRCANVDLGYWLHGKYAIPAVDAADDTIDEALIEKQITVLQGKDDT